MLVKAIEMPLQVKVRVCVGQDNVCKCIEEVPRNISQIHNSGYIGESLKGM